MRRWWLVLALLLSVGVNIGVLLTLATGGSRFRAARSPDAVLSLNEGRGGWVIERMADELGLVGTRRERFAEIQRTFLRAMVVGRREVARRQRAFYQALAAEQPDREEIERHGAAVVKAQGALERALAESVLQSRALLEGEEDRRFLRMLARVLQRLRSPEPPGVRRKKKPRPDGIGRGEGGGEDVSFSGVVTELDGKAFAFTP